jgi:hypothetical protein
MFFVGSDPATGRTAIGRATSQDGKTWALPDEPIDLGDGASGRFARDGVGGPAALVRGETVHLWFTGFDGARASIAYAVGARHNAQEWRWETFGVALEAASTWEASRVVDPAVVVMPTDVASSAAGLGVLHLWYAAGPPGRERIGLAVREIPARVDATGAFGYAPAAR